MLTLFGIVLPVFLLIGIGFAARHFGLIGERAGEGLSDFVFVLAIPCLLFRTLARAELPVVQPFGYWAAYFIAVALVWMLATHAARRLFGRGGPAAVTCGFAAAQSNTVLVGIPIILKAFGEPAAVPLALLIGIHLPVMMLVATLLVEGSRASPGAIGLKLVSHPILIGIVLGSVARPVVDVTPSAIWTVIDLLAGAAVPAALVTLGIGLHRHGLQGGLKLPLLLSFLKLVVQPAIVFVLAVHVFTMPPLWAGAAVMFAACPCGINAYLFAERYKAGMSETSAAIALSTPLSIITMVGWLALLGVSP